MKTKTHILLASGMRIRVEGPLQYTRDESTPDLRILHSSKETRIIVFLPRNLGGASFIVDKVTFIKNDRCASWEEVENEE